MTILDSCLIYFGQNASHFDPIAGMSVGFNENATLPFQPGKTYRLRIVNTSAFVAFYFRIDGHDMSIIEVDGVSLKYVLFFFYGPLFVGADFYLCRLMLRHRL